MGNRMEATIRRRLMIPLAMGDRTRPTFPTESLFLTQFEMQIKSQHGWKNSINMV